MNKITELYNHNVGIPVKGNIGVKVYYGKKNKYWKVFRVINKVRDRIIIIFSDRSKEMLTKRSNGNWAQINKHNKVYIKYIFNNINDRII